MGGIEDRIKELEEEISKTKYNKATSHHIGLLKARIAKLKVDQELFVKKSSHSGPSYAVKKTGDATVLFVGFPSVGKSTLINQLTNAASKVASYDFTTLDVIPGLMDYKGARIQLLDVPGIIEGATRGKGRGREIFSVIRNADLLLIILDKPGQLKKIHDELYLANLRINQGPPDVLIKKKISGGIHLIISTKQTSLTGELAKGVLNEYGIHNADVVIRENITVDQFIDVITGNRKYVPAVTLINKVDALSADALAAIKKETGEVLTISAQTGKHLDQLREAIYHGLDFIHIYLKKIGAEPDFKDPLIIKGDHTIEGACNRICAEWIERFQYARVWGASAKFPGQTVGIEHLLKGGDVLELHLKR